MDNAQDLDWGRREERERGSSMNQMVQQGEIAESLGHKTAKAERERMKRLLLEWGGSLDICERKQEEIRKMMQMQETCAVLSKQGKHAEFQRILMRYEDGIFCLQKEIQQILEMKKQMDEAIAVLTQEEQELLFLRYQKGYGYDHIAWKLHMGRSTCFRIHDKILQKLLDLEQRKNFC